jgi:thiol-disulfide isomerase/thioredoxin
MIKGVSTATLLFVLSPLVLGQVGTAAPQLTLKDIQGRTLRVSDYKGQVVLLNFWATWCAPCRTEMPDLVRWQREYRNRGLRVIGITYPPQALAQVRKFTRSIRVNYPIVLGRTETRAQFDKGEVLPITVVIDRQGTIREIIEGIMFPEEFEQKVKPLL